MNAEDIKRYVADHDDHAHNLAIVADGEVVVLQGPPGLFLYSRTTGYAYEVVPDPVCGIMVHAI